MKIKLYYTASQLKRYISITYDEKVPLKLSEGVAPDDLHGLLDEKVEGTHTNSIDSFSKELINDATFKPFGEKLDSFKICDKDTHMEREFEVYKPEVSSTGFKEFVERMRTFLLFFIDGASYIDDDDDRWDYFIIYEKVSLQGSGLSNGHGARHNFVGYTTVYRYFAYPNKIRPRISQVLVLPPFQRRGVGARMLQTVYNYYSTMSEVIDITVEDPSDDFVRLRDYVDSKNCRELESFSKANLANGWTDDMATDAKKKHRLNKKQARRVYEILKLAATDRNNEEAYRSYRLEVKQRLNAPFAKMSRSAEKSFSDNTTAIATKEMRLETLKNLYKETEDEYLETIEKLATC